MVTISSMPTLSKGRQSKVPLPALQVKGPSASGSWPVAMRGWYCWAKIPATSSLRLIAEGDRVAERWTGRGTHLAELHLGELQGIPPTGKRVEAPGSVFYRIVDGRIVEFRGQFDMMGLMQQLGAIASPQ